MMAIFVSSSFGSSLKGVRDQPRRMAALGFNPWLIRWITFIYAGFWGGVSGLLYVYYNKYIHPTSLSTTSSAEALLGVIAGGSGTLGGPVVGAALVLLLKNYASAYLERWNMLLGLVFLFIVLVMPSGHRSRLEQACGGIAQGIAMTPPTSGHALEIVDLKKAFGGLIVTQERLARDPAGRTPPDHRPERRRQDHAVQPDQRRHAAEFGTDQAVRHRRHQHSRPTGARISACREPTRSSRCSRAIRSNTMSRFGLLGLRPSRWQMWRPLSFYGDLATEARAHPRCGRAAASRRTPGFRYRLWRKAPRRARDGAGAKAARTAARRTAGGTFEHRAIHR